jgi:acyl CoA:acetate/3-ketoacid CoA transferase beta subunit
VSDITRAEVCVVACADAWRGDGEIVCSPMGTIPRIGALLARATFEPDLLISDGEAYLQTADGVTEGWLPFRSVFDVVAAGRRHVMMGASQIDRFGNQNISAVGDWAKPKVQLLGARGAPGNTVNHTTSYWVPGHTARVFTEQVDFVSGVGYDRARAAGRVVQDFHEIRVVVSNLGVFDFQTPDNAMRVRSLHPGVTVDEVVAATGFELAVGTDLEESRLPTDQELRLIREVLDSDDTRSTEVPQP